MSAAPGDSELPPSGQPASSAPASEPERLWRPWRMQYVARAAREDGCVFCELLAADDDTQSLILHRGDRAFVIMNLFPYNTGHVMIVPYAHVSSPEEAEPETLHEMAALRAPVLRALRRALSCEGFNVGMNVGAVAGAGVADHLHEHVVPRWLGDANFMPLLARTTVLPELIPVTYAKLRAEMARELRGERTIDSLVLSENGQTALVAADGGLRSVLAEEGVPLWRTALRDAAEGGAADAELAGWAGAPLADHGRAAVLIRATFPGGDTTTAHRLAPLESLLTGPRGPTVHDALVRSRIISGEETAG